MTMWASRCRWGGSGSGLCGKTTQETPALSSQPMVPSENHRSQTAGSVSEPAAPWHSAALPLRLLPAARQHSPSWSPRPSPALASRSHLRAPSVAWEPQWCGWVSMLHLLSILLVQLWILSYIFLDNWIFSKLYMPFMLQKLDFMCIISYDRSHTTAMWVIIIIFTTQIRKHT